jgi:hypothetical protein
LRVTCELNLKVTKTGMIWNIFSCQDFYDLCYKYKPITKKHIFFFLLLF